MSQIFGQAIGIHGQRSLLGFQVRTNWKLCLISDLLLVLKSKLNPILLSQISLNSLVRHIPLIFHGSHGYTHVNFFGRCKFLQIYREKLAFWTDFTRKSGVFFTDLTRKIGVFRCKFYSPKILPV